MNNTLHNRLRHHVTGAIERGETQAIVEIPTLHTSGPWYIAHHTDANGIKSIDIRHCSDIQHSTPQIHQIARLPENALANARLIAAAPDLLSALESLAVWNDGEPCFCHVHGESERARYTPHDSYCDKARAAITKAKGAK